MFKEYPKMLYRADKTTIAKDSDSEQALRLDGWHDFGQEVAPKQQDGKPATKAPTRSTKPAPKQQDEA